MNNLILYACTYVGSTAKIAVTWKTRDVCDAALMDTALNLVDIMIQAL